MNYTLDIEAAKSANSTGRITKTGAYIGVFTKAKAVVSKNQTQGIEFAFKDEFGNTADFLSLWTVKETGEKIFGYNVLMSLMTCLQLRNIQTAEGAVEEYDSVAKQVLPTRAIIYPALMDVRIGVLLQAQEYKNGNGEIKTSMAIAGFFHPETRMVAKEILEKAAKPELLQKMIDRLPEVKKLPGTSASPAPSASHDIADDDIPF